MPAPIEKTSLKRFAAQLSATLEAVESRGVRWRGTRFDTYLRIVSEAAEFDYPRSFPWADDHDKRRLFFEGACQAQQLMDSVPVWSDADDAIVDGKLRQVLSGTPLPPDSVDADLARNTLAELVTAALLQRKRFVVGLTRDAEDVRATFAPLLPFLVECKRPAHEASLERNLKELRRQLRNRRDGRNDYGLGVIAVDRILGLAGSTDILPNAAALAAVVVDRVGALVADVQRLDAERRLDLYPHVSLGALLLVGAVFLDDPGILVTVSQMGMFCTAPETHATSRRIMGVLRPSVEMTHWTNPTG